MADEKKKADKPDKSDEKPKKAPPSEEKGGGGEGGKAAKAAAPADGVKGPVFMGIIAGIIVFNLVAAVVLVNVLMPRKPKAEATVESADTTAHHGESVEGAGEKPEASAGMIVTAKPIDAVINIAGTDGKRYLKVGVQLEFNSLKYKDNLKLIEEGELNPKLKSLLIDQVSQMTMDELLEPDAKEKICKEYLRRINSAIPEKFVQFAEVFLVDFLVQ